MITRSMSVKYERGQLDDSCFLPDLLFEPKPHAKGKRWTNDERGFRRYTHFNDRMTEGTIKIAITGGSTAWGAGGTDDQTIPSILAKELKKRCVNQSFHVWNAAVPAQTSGQEREAFRDISIAP